MRTVAFAAAALSLACAAASCASGPSPVTPPPPSPPPEPPAPPKREVPVTLEQVGLSSTALQKSADPCQDFYQHACGGWLEKTEVPADRSSWIRSFSEIHQRNELELRSILEEAAKKRGQPGVEGKIGAFYAACMDEAAIEKAGLTPVKPLLDVVDRARDREAIAKALIELHRHRVWAFFDVDAQQDDKDATKMIAIVDQNGLGMPDRDYYTRTDDEAKKLRETYRAHVTRMFELAGEKPQAAKAAADDVLRIETKLAEASKTRVERRDPKSLYNRLDREGLAKAAPSIPWASYWTALGKPEVKEISVTAPKFMERVDDVIEHEKLPALKNYLTWHVLHDGAPRLTKAFVEEDFKLAQALTGQKELRPRWKRCIAATDAALGEALAQAFVARKFAGASKQAAETYVREIAAAMRQRLDELQWMDETTRERARKKLESLAYLVGYPSKWKTYDYPIGDSYAKNVYAWATFELARDLGKIGKPVDREEWEMTPPTVNAYYHPNKNQMVFPAGILQPPFYSVDASIPVNLGAMGMVVGHELTHGFDDQGAQFDAAGNLKDWWEPATQQAFQGRTKCVEEQYGQYEPIAGAKINGKLTLGENIADAGGIKLAFRAYRNMTKDAPVEQIASGYTEDQQFFLATAQIWCAEYRDEAARLQVQTDPHSHPRFRVNGPLSQLPEFAQAFSCKPGSPMVAANACEVW
jgi:predicted metalloendopeptidase